MAHVSVVVPVYDESAVLPELYRRLKAALVSLEPDHSHGVVFVDDGSTDASPAWLANLARRDTAVRVLTLSRNFGHQMAITAGLDVAGGDAVVVMDADLQDPPEVIPGMVARWASGAHVVYGVRRRRAGESVALLACSRAFYRMLAWMSDTPLPADSGDFRLLDRRVVEVLRGLREHDRYVRGLVAWAGFRQEPLVYDRDARFAGCPKYTWRARAKLALDAATSFSSRPLTLLACVGAACAVGAVVAAVWRLRGAAAGAPLTVAEAVLLGALFVGGAQLVAMGMLGQWTSRILRESKRRPLYVVADAGVPAAAVEAPVALRRKNRSLTPVL
jgi:glycosyltransferase involved in cell wall biosynthesis